MKEFWYESNSCWGNVRSLGDLKEKIELQLEENNGIDTIDQFLDESKQVDSGSDNFGTRSEHTGGKSLRDFLTEDGFDFNLIKNKMKVTVYSGLSVEGNCGTQLHPLTEVRNVKEKLNGNTGELTFNSNSTDFIYTVYHYGKKLGYEVEFYLDDESVGDDIEVLFKDFNRSFDLISEIL